MLLRIVVGRRRWFGVHYLQYGFYGSVAVEHLCRHHIDGTTPDDTTPLRSSPGNRSTIPLKSHCNRITTTTDAKWITTDVELAAMTRTRMMTIRQPMPVCCETCNVTCDPITFLTGWPPLTESCYSLSRIKYNIIRVRYRYKWRDKNKISVLKACTNH